jgi:PLP dependent protein
MYDARLKETLPRAEERIAATMARAGRPDTVRLVAVTKGHPAAAVDAAFRAGIRTVGENRVQELEAKRGEVSADTDVAWHLIGHLQRNKVRQVLPLVDMIHSVDSLRLAQEVSKEAERVGGTASILVQVNMSGEETKGGFSGEAAVEGIARVTELPGMRVMGLMTMAPFTEDAAVVRETFRRTRDTLERCIAQGLGLQGRELSMGMSSDYEIAIEEGSTMIRLGTILFGERA